MFGGVVLFSTIVIQQRNAAVCRNSRIDVLAWKKEKEMPPRRIERRTFAWTFSIFVDTSATIYH